MGKANTAKVDEGCLRLAESGETRRCTRFKHGAHSIKGVAGNLGLERLQRTAGRAETWAREKIADGAADADAATARETCDRLGALVDEVKAWNETARETLTAFQK